VNYSYVLRKYLKNYQRAKVKPKNIASCFCFIMVKTMFFFEETSELACKVDDTYPRAHKNLGLALECLGQYDKAKLEYEKCIKLDETYDKAYTCLAEIYKREGNREEEKKLRDMAQRIKIWKMGNSNSLETPEPFDSVYNIQFSDKDTDAEEESKTEKKNDAAEADVVVEAEVEVNIAGEVKETMNGVENVKANDARNEEEVTNADAKIDVQNDPIKPDDVLENEDMQTSADDAANGKSEEIKVK